MAVLASEEDGRLSIWRLMLNPRRLLSRGNPTKKTRYSYFSLFRPLQDVQSRCILVCGTLLAIAAGAPLPIIGVIFARIIDAFPPSEEQVQTRITQLLGVGMSILLLMRCLSDSEEIFSCCILCLDMGLGLLLGHSWCQDLQRTPPSAG